MKAETLLAEGINILRKNDEDIDRLAAARCEEIVSLLGLYIKEIELFNAAYGLIGTGDTKEIVIKHILDSISPLGIIFRLLTEFCAFNDGGTNTPQIADAGSGAGLPGIPLAIALPKCNFTLIERMNRRAGFLLNTKAILDLSNITVEERELEKTGGHFSLVVFRAFKPLGPKMLKIFFNTATKGGLIAAYKGRREKIEQEMALLKNASVQWEAVPYSIPFLEDQRHLLVIREKQLR
ncbi:MAG: 16S rRNA (guanine(527)-N(7))-methyltransferase RsmG [Treponema sp.]|nr:16S rRNA (guanine(527)-N(7))-methyltransferase RsmG [Treponema sp.]